jgi:hypothetical protein
MLKKAAFVALGVAATLGGIHYFSNSGSSGKRVGIFENKNPYSRKPASLVHKKVIKKKPVALKKKANIDSRISGLAEIKNCYIVKCDFEANDSREYDLTVGQNLKKELFNLYESVLRKEINDPKITAVGIEYLKVPNGHVKEAALLLLSTQEPSQEALSAITENVLDYHDANLVGLALMELEKYKTGEYDVIIKESFIKNFDRGSLMVKEALAKGIYRFVNEANRNEYHQILEGLPKGSRVRRNLKASLDRYDHSARL